MDTKNIKILSGPEAADRMRGEDKVLEQLLLELPYTKRMIKELLEKNPDDTGVEARVAEERRRAKWPKFEEGKATIATVDEEIAAMTHYDPVGHWKGRPVFELSAVSTLPLYRRQRLSSRVSDRCMQEMVKQDPKALCLVQTSTLDLLTRYNGWVAKGIASPISGDAIYDMWRQYKNLPPLDSEERAQIQESYVGCDVFLIDLKKLAEQGGLKEER